MTDRYECIRAVIAAAKERGMKRSEPTTIDVLGWIAMWAVFLGLLFLLMHYEPALRC